MTVQPSPGSTVNMETLVFIASPGHTGSTLLDLLLGNHPAAVSVGEVHRLDEWASHPDTHLCTCGRPVPECPFWLDVQDRLRVATGLQNLNLATLPTHVPQANEALHRRTPRPEDLAWIIGSRRLWRAGARLNRSIRAQAEAGEHVSLIYEAVCGASGASVVIDSSKDPSQLKTRWYDHPDRIRILFQLRDGRAVCRSQMRREGVDMPSAARKWRRQILNQLAMLATIPRRAKLRTRYEDLCRTPEAEIARIARFCRLPGDPPKLVLRKEDAHNIGGNPMRFRKDEVQINVDERWRGDLDAADLRCFERIGGRLNRFLGYR